MPLTRRQRQAARLALIVAVPWLLAVVLFLILHLKG